jgi:hypothetical protein
MNTQQTALSMVTLANASDLVANIVLGTMGNGVAETFNGSPLTKQALYEMSQVTFQGALTKHMGGR